MRKIYLLKNLLLMVSLMLCSFTYAQSISGTVSDASGPLPGANVIVKGTTNGAITDFDGKYTLNNVGADAVIVVSYVGYISHEVNVGGRSTVNVTLQEDASQLDEVVVMGYSTQTRGDVTGSVASVDTDEALKAPVVNASEALQGRVTGVTVVNNSSPGATPKINIRGFGTSNNTNPLFIIDGVQTDDPNILNNINSADIDQMNVLKDGAAAIYGARASNGVVIITTKSGGYNMDKAKISVDMYTGISQIANAPDLLNPTQHADMLWQSMINAGVTPSHPQYGSGSTPFVPGSIQGYRRVISYNPIVFGDNFNATTKVGGTDWIDAITQDAPTSNVAFSMENGTESGKYFMSVGYLTRDGIMNYTGFKRVTSRLNSEFKIKDKITIGEHLNVSYSNTKSGVGEAIEMALRMTPLLPVRDDAGEYTGVAGPGLGNTRNPAAQLYRSDNDYNKRISIFGDVYLQYEILPELKFKTTLAAGMNTFDRRSFTYLDPEHGEPISENSMNEQDQTSYNWSWSNVMNYNKRFDDHSVNALVGVEALKDGGKGKGISRSGYLFEDPDFYLLNNGSGTPSVDYAYDGYNSLFSVFGNVNYSYLDKYYLSGTLRRDESSRFLGDNKSDIFPSASVGWVVSKEDFFGTDGFIDRLKLKASYGELGNQTLPANNPTINISGLSESQANYSFDGSTITQGAILSQVGNPNLKWETSVTTNFGAELTMLDGALSLTGEYFVIKTKDLITRDFSLISSTAIDAGAPLVNLGDIENRGFDFSLGYRNQTDSGFTYAIDANISHYKNEVKNLISSFVSGRGDLRNGAVTRTEVGEEMSYFYGRNVVGFTNDGRFQYEDVNGDGTVDDDDRTKIGSPHADFTYGINLNLGYKGFDASFFFNGSQGNDVYNYNKVFTDFPLFVNGNRSTRVLDSWTPSNTDATLPALLNSGTNNESSSNSYFVEDGSFFRLKNLQLGYTFPTNVAEKMGADSFRFYLQGTNLFTITDYEGFDPEIVAYDNLSLGIDSRIYPNSRIMSIGVNVKF